MLNYDPKLDLTFQALGDPSRRAALSALLVACISRHDGTRIPQGENRLLSEPFCRRVLGESLRFALRGA